MTEPVPEKISSESEKRHDEPAPLPSIGYYIFYLLGVATLVPWNFVITNEYYWAYKFRNVSSNTNEERGEMFAQFYSNMSSVSMVTNMLFLILTALFGHRFDKNRRMLVSMSLLIVLFSLTTVLVYVDSDGWQHQFMIATLVKFALISAAGAILQSTLFGIAAQITGPYVSAIMSGQSMGAVFTNICCIVSLSFAVGADPRHQALVSALVFFIIAVLIIMLSMYSYVWISRQPVLRGSLTKQELQPRDENKSTESGAGLFMKIIYGIRWYAAGVTMVFVVTLALFPTITVSIRPMWRPESRWARVYFRQVACFLLFNTTDLLGRIAGGKQFLSRFHKGPFLFVLSLMRFAFIPLIMFCNVEHTQLTTVFANDLYYVAFMALFGLTNGYLATLCMIYGPQAVSDNQQSVASSSMAAFLGIGLSIGSTLSKPLVKLL